MWSCISFPPTNQAARLNQIFWICTHCLVSSICPPSLFMPVTQVCFINWIFCFLFGFWLRLRQVYEMALSGWSFHVLSPIFTIHWGMQMKQRRPAWRKNQMDRNRRLFDVIHHELKAKYGLLNKSPVRWHPKPAVSSGSGRLNSDVKQQHPLLVAAKSAARTSIWLRQNTRR